MSTLMIFAVFTLSLVCDMSFCPMQAHAAEAVRQTTNSDVPPCHEPKEQSKEQSSDCDLMMNMDCLGIDVVHADNSLGSSDKNSSQIDLAWISLSIEYNIQLVSSNIIRGPPFDTSQPHLNNHDLYLTTQRLRI